jgi:hypothetical protein
MIRLSFPLLAQAAKPSTSPWAGSGHTHMHPHTLRGLPGLGERDWRRVERNALVC